MDIVIIYKQDGSIQCQQEPRPRPLEADEEQLLSIGFSRICGRVNTGGPGVVGAACGLPTSQVNAFAVLKADWERVLSGFVGTLGFRLWAGAPYPEIDVDEDCSITDSTSTAPRSAAATPVLARELIGMQLRVYREGDPLTQDYIPGRANIETADDGRTITDVWYG